MVSSKFGQCMRLIRSRLTSLIRTALVCRRHMRRVQQRGREFHLYSRFVRQGSVGIGAEVAAEELRSCQGKSVRVKCSSRLYGHYGGV